MIIYRAGRLNSTADALSHSPLGGSNTQAVETGVLSVRSKATTTCDQAEDTVDIPALLAQPPVSRQNEDFASEQRQDPESVELITYLEQGKLPVDDQKARQFILQKPFFTLESGILIFIDPKQDDGPAP